MKATYDAASSVLYVKADGAEIYDSTDIGGGVIVNRDAAGNVCGVQIMGCESGAPIVPDCPPERGAVRSE